MLTARPLKQGMAALQRGRGESEFKADVNRGNGTSPSTRRTLIPRAGTDRKVQIRRRGTQLVKFVFFLPFLESRDGVKELQKRRSG